MPQMVINIAINIRASYPSIALLSPTMAEETMTYRTKGQGVVELMSNFLDFESSVGARRTLRH